MADEPLNEEQRRALAEANMDDFDIESAKPVAPRRMGQMVSLRLDPDVAFALRELAEQRGVSMSDLLREGAARVLAAAEQSLRVTDIRVAVDMGRRTHTAIPRPTSSLAFDADTLSTTQATSAA